MRKLPRDEASCLWQKINIYLAEYLGKDIFKELDMAFVSIGQKYGFESAGDYFREQIAEAEEEGRVEGKAEGIAEGETKDQRVQGVRNIARKNRRGKG